MKSKIVCSLILVMFILAISQSSFANESVYDPTIHVYREGLEGPGIGKIQLNGGPSTQSVEEGPWFWEDWDGGGTYYKGEDNVRWWACGEDHYADFYYVPEDRFFEPVVTSGNGISYAHIEQNGGLHGGYYCVGGYCTISLCTTSVPGSDPTFTLLYWP